MTFTTANSIETSEALKKVTEVYTSEVATS